jgi:hypothetical protein
VSDSNETTETKISNETKNSAADQGMALPATGRLLFSEGVAPDREAERRPGNTAVRRATMAGLAAEIAAEHQGDDPKVVNLAYYRIKKSLQQEGFDLITDGQGKLTLVLRVGR